MTRSSHSLSKDPIPDTPPTNNSTNVSPKTDPMAHSIYVDTSSNTDDEWDMLDRDSNFIFDDSASNIVLESLSSLTKNSRTSLKSIWERQRHFISSFANRSRSIPKRTKHPSTEKKKRHFSWTKLSHKLRNKSTSLMRKLKEKKWIRLIDRTTFVIGVLGVLITEFMILREPEYFGLFYTVVIFPLLLWRMLAYRQNRWGYFLLDFCYFTQILLMLFLWVFPTNSRLFATVFALCNGPLLFAIPVWKNALVFHDVDKLTSLSIHILPALTTYAIRWHSSPVGPQALFQTVLSSFDPRQSAPANNSSIPDPNLHLGNPHVCEHENCVMPFKDSILMPFVAYCVWQTAYYFITEIFNRETIRLDKRIVTSKRWMITHESPIRTIALWSGVSPRFYLFVFIFCQALYQILSTIPVFLLFQIQWLHKLVIVGIVTQALFNGANYYFFRFVKYQQKYFD